MIRRVLLTAACCSVTAAATLGAVAASAGAAVPAKTVKSCSLLKPSEISQAFGGATVSPGKADTNTALSNECDFEVAATPDFPEGTVTVHVMSSRGKIAFKAHQKGTFGFQPVAGEKGVLYWDKTGSAEMLKGDAIIGVQGVFLNDQIQQEDVQSQVVGLNKLAVKRA